jgi:hypothetical protein
VKTTKTEVAGRYRELFMGDEREELEEKDK